MGNLKELQTTWRSFTRDRQNARVPVVERLNQITEQQAALVQEKADLQAAFEETWREEKLKRKQELDDAVRAELRSGRSAQEILRELGSNNTVWIYDLRKEVMDAFGNVEQELSKPQADARIDGIRWQHHDHTGVRGYLLDVGRSYIKVYDTSQGRGEAEYFVCDRDHNFVLGSKQLFERTKPAEVDKRANMLEKLLEGTYHGKLVLEDNPYTN